MSHLATLYERNAAFAASFSQGDLPLEPALSMLIVTCVDPRVDPARYAGIELGDAFVLRSVGARVTDTVALEVSMVWMLLTLASGTDPSLEVAIIQHTGCGMARFAEPEVAERVTERFGTADVVRTYGIADSHEAVRQDVEKLQSHRVAPDGLRVSGHLYDIATGRLEEVVPATPIG